MYKCIHTHTHTHTHTRTCQSVLLVPFLPLCLTQVEVDKLVSSHMRKEERGSWSWWRWGRRSSSIPAKINEVGHMTVT